MKSNIERVGDNYQKALCFLLEPDSENWFKVFAKVNNDNINQGEKITFSVNDLATKKSESITSIFVFSKIN